MAWRLSTGDDSVRIVVTDSGINWDNDDLIEKVWLNQKELTAHKPLHADGMACAGDGELAGFDCNGDGILTVADYAETATLQPPASGERPLGDRNATGKLISVRSPGVMFMMPRPSRATRTPARSSG